MHDVIIIPTYNERDNIRLLIPKIFARTPNVFILVVDDSSPDGTSAEVKKMAKKYRHLGLIIKEEKEGLGAAYRYALTYVAFDPTIRTIITMDADGSHDPLFLETLLGERERYDLVVGSRYIPGGRTLHWPLHRELLSRWGNVYARIVTGIPIKDMTSGFMAFDRSFLGKINLEHIRPTGYAYQIEFKYACMQAGTRYIEVPIVFKEREVGQSKITGSIVVEGIFTPLRLRLLSIFDFFNMFFNDKR